MRKVAEVSRPGSAYRRVMLDDPGDGGGVSLFLFRSTDDSPCEADHWYESAADAERAAAEVFGVGPGDWRAIPDPAPGRPHDRLD